MHTRTEARRQEMRVGRLEKMAIAPAATIATISIHSSIARDLALPEGLLLAPRLPFGREGEARQWFMGRGPGCARTALTSRAENGSKPRLFRRKSRQAPKNTPTSA